MNFLSLLGLGGERFAAPAGLPQPEGLPAPGFSGLLASALGETAPPAPPLAADELPAAEETREEDAATVPAEPTPAQPAPLPGALPAPSQAPPLPPQLAASLTGEPAATNGEAATATRPAAGTPPFGEAPHALPVVPSAAGATGPSASAGEPGLVETATGEAQPAAAPGALRALARALRPAPGPGAGAVLERVEAPATGATSKPAAPATPQPEARVEAPSPAMPLATAARAASPPTERGRVDREAADPGADGFARREAGQAVESMPPVRSVAAAQDRSAAPAVLAPGFPASGDPVAEGAAGLPVPWPAQREAAAPPGPEPDPKGRAGQAEALAASPRALARPGVSTGEPLPTPARAALRSAELPERAVRILRELRADGAREYRAELQLDPPGLGRVRIDVQLSLEGEGEPQRALTRITVETAAAHEQMQAELPRIRSLLAEQGLGAVQVELHWRESQGQSGRQQGRERAPRRSGEAALDTTAARDGWWSTHDGLIDLRA